MVQEVAVKVVEPVLHFVASLVVEVVVAVVEEMLVVLVVAGRLRRVVERVQAVAVEEATPGAALVMVLMQHLVILVQAILQQLQQLGNQYH